MRIKTFIAFTFLYLYSSGFIRTLKAQVPHLKFEHITSENGLPQNTIHGIVKDKYGFMWFGTWAGLCRYDGYNFKVYKYHPQNSKSINNNRIHNIIKDREQNIWILTFQEDELCKYNYLTDDFDRIPAKKISTKFLKLINRRNHYETVSFKYKQYSWSLDNRLKALKQTNHNSSMVSYYRPYIINKWSLNDIYVTDIYKDNHEMLWVGTYSNGLNKANLLGKHFEYFYQNLNQPNAIIDNNVKTICEDKQHNLWVGTRDGGITVIGYDNKKHFLVKELPDNQIRKIFCDSKGNIWIGSKKGLTFYNSSTKVFKQIDKLQLKNTTVFGITEDNQSNLWFASWKGIYKYSYKEDKWLHFNPKTTLKNKHARIIVQDKIGQLWVGTEGGGISVLASKANDSLYAKNFFLHDYKNKNTISDNNINYIYEDREGIIWIGTGNGLDRYQPQIGKFTHFSAESGLADATIAGIIEDDNGFIWISHKKGIFKIHKKTLKVRNYTLQDGLQSNEFSEGAVFKSNYRNRLYFGSNNGFNAFNPDSIFTDSNVPNTVLTELYILNEQVKINQVVNGRIILHTPLYLTKEIVLHHEDNNVAFEFAGLHYSNPKGNKYAYKLEGFDTDWVYTSAANRIAKYSNLDAGNYTFKVISSNSDGVWNRKPAVLKVIVTPPIWLSGWAYSLYALLILITLYLYHYYASKFTYLRSRLSYESLIREKEHELHQSKMKFFTNISHEIKTPLTLIISPIDKLLQNYSDHHVLVSQLKTMHINSVRLLKLVNELLDFRKLEIGNLKLNKERKDIITFIRNFLSSFESLANDKKIKLQLVSEKSFFEFYYDEDKLEKVLANLLANAFKFTPNLGEIKVFFTVYSNENKVCIGIENTGDHILEEDKEKIFMPFQQGSNYKLGGTGLGLAFSKALILLQGGKLWTENITTALGVKKVVFYIELPLDNTPVVDSNFNEYYKENKDLRSLNKCQKTNTILIVEDHLDLRQYLKEHFEEQYNVIVAENGKQGLTLAATELPDLILSDIMMPELDGLAFCRLIKTEIKTAHIPVILLTAKTPLENGLEGLETGADDYITKPFNILLIAAKIKNILHTRSLLKEKYRREISLQPVLEIPLSSDEKMLKKLLYYIEEHIAEELYVDDLCLELGVSRAQLYRKIKTLTGLSVAEIIKEIRLKRAKQLLMEKKFNINEISYMVGFSDPDYFRKCFKSEFGLTPTEYYKNINETLN